MTSAERTIVTHTGHIAGLQTSIATKANTTDVSALTTTVAANTTAITTKADGSALTSAERTIVTHTGLIAGLTSSYNNIGNSFYTKTLTDALLSGKQNALSNNGGSGIGLLNNAEVRQVTAVAPLSATILYDFANPSDPDNNNIELSIDLTSIQSDINAKEPLITNGI